ncbi:MAG TPA: hypothetical protein VNR37_02085 [Microbacteriaceae bacterium]|nr:hypothetical protein [Microbacteriaceae bacterium]
MSIVDGTFSVLFVLAITLYFAVMTVLGLPYATAVAAPVTASLLRIVKKVVVPQQRLR